MRLIDWIALWCDRILIPISAGGILVGIIYDDALCLILWYVNFWLFTLSLYLGHKEYKAYRIIKLCEEYCREKGQFFATEVEVKVFGR